MNEYQIKPIDHGWNMEMLGILRDAPIITDMLTVCFDRQPDLFALVHCKYDDFFYSGLFHGETLKGFGMVGYHTVLVNGVPTEVFCARDLYILPEARGQGFIPRSTENHFRENQHRTPIGYGVIMQGNKASLRLVGNKPESNRYSPKSRIINKLMIRTIFLIFPISAKSSYKIRRAQREDIPAMVALLNNEHRDRLFGNIYNEATFQSRLERSTGLSVEDYFLAYNRLGVCCGVCAAWDMSGMKQTRVVKYGKAFLPSQIAWKSLSFFYDLPPLPVSGDHFREVTITDYAVMDRDPEIMHALLQTVYSEYRQKGYHFMIWGSSIDDPLLKASKGFIGQSIISNIVLFSTDDQWLEDGKVKNNLPYIDISAI